MSLFVFANFYSEYVTAYCSSTSATISVSSASSLPALGVDQVIPLVLTNAATQSVFEIVYVTAVSGTTLTILRAQEGTIAQNWQVNDLISCDPTAASVGASNISPATTSSQPVPLGQALNVVTVTATGNITLGNVLKTLVSADGATAVITLTLEPGTVVGQEVTFRSNTYGYTVRSNVTTGTPWFLAADGTGVYSWALPGGQSTLTFRWDSTNWHVTSTGNVVGLPATASNQFTTRAQSMQLGVYNVTSNRAFNVVFTNSGLNTKFAIVTVAMGAAAIIGINVNGSQEGEYGSPSADTQSYLFFVIPPGMSYELTNVAGGVPSFSNWTEVY